MVCKCHNVTAQHECIYMCSIISICIWSSGKCNAVFILLFMRASMSVCVGVGVLPVLAACRCPFVISSLCQWEFQASHWADWIDQSVCNSPSTICRPPNSPLLWSCTDNEGLLFLRFYLKASLVTRCFSKSQFNHFQRKSCVKPCGVVTVWVT